MTKPSYAKSWGHEINLGWYPQNQYGAWSATPNSLPTRPLVSPQEIQKTVDKANFQTKFIKSDFYKQQGRCPFCGRDVTMDSLFTHVAVEHTNRDLWRAAIHDQPGRPHHLICVCGHEESGKDFLFCLDALIEHARLNVDHHRMALLLGAEITGEVQCHSDVSES